MIKRGRFTQEEYNKHLKELTLSVSHFMDFLKTSSHLAKYPFEEQLSIYMQNPNAQATADFDTWNKVGRYVKRGSKGIAVRNEETDQWRFVFDITDTRSATKNSFHPWTLKEENITTVLEHIEHELGMETKTHEEISTRLEHIVANSLAQNIDDMFDEFQEIDFTDTFFEELDELNRKAILRETLETSILYVVAQRLNLQDTLHISEDSFNHLWNFKDPYMIVSLCEFSQKLSNSVLLDFERSSKSIEKNRESLAIDKPVRYNALKRESENDKEEQQYDKRPRVQARGRLSSTRDRVGETERHWEIRSDEERILDGNQKTDDQVTDDTRKTESHSRESERGRHGNATFFDGEKTGETPHARQENEPHPVDSGVQNAPTRSRRGHHGRTDLHPIEEVPEQLSFFPTVEEQIQTILKADDEKSTAFFVSPKPDIAYFSLGNGLSVVDRNQLENGDYKKIAHISANRMVQFYDTALPEDIKSAIEHEALSSHASGSATQDIPVFSIPPIMQLDNVLVSDKNKYRYWVGDKVTLPFQNKKTPFQIMDFYKDNVRIRNTETPENIYQLPFLQFGSLLDKATENAKYTKVRETTKINALFKKNDLATKYDVRARSILTLTNSEDKPREYIVTGFEDTAIHLQDTKNHGQMALSLASLEKRLDECAAQNIGLLKPVEFQKAVTDIKVNAMLDQAMEVINQYERELSSEEMEQDPFVVFEFSENEQFQENETLSFQKADEKIKQVEEDINAGEENGYDKTYGTVYYLENPKDTEYSTYAFRYDIGDYEGENSGLLADIQRQLGYAQTSENRESITYYEKLLGALERPLEQQTLNHLKTVELDTEEGYSFIDGVRNNLPKDREFEKREQQNEEFREREFSEQIAEEEGKDEQERLGNFKIRDTSLGIGGGKSKFQFNVSAITLLRTLEQENRTATPEEQEILSKYVGFGGMPQVFDEHSEKWHKEYVTLKELLSPEEYIKARASTLNAFYTNPTVITAMYETLENMGFQKGNVLEPSMAVGNFFGLLPESMKESSLYGVELDDISGRIAKQLYPNANIQITGFEKTNFEDNFFDVAIGNVPFGSYTLNDPVYNAMKLPIHDYFFAKALDKVRPDGVIAFITSKGTLDKKNASFRRFLSKKADLLGAIRLPNNAFKQNANTEVTTDILFLKKRATESLEEPDWVKLGETDDGIPVNQYFTQHPEMILGEMVYDSSMYGRETDTACKPFFNMDLKTELYRAIGNITYKMEDISLEALEEIKSQKAIAKEIAVDSPAFAETIDNFSYATQGGHLYYRRNDKLLLQEKNGRALERTLDMIPLRDSVKQVLNAQLHGITDEGLKAMQVELQNHYDTFYQKHGLLNHRGNELAFGDDDSYPLLCSLEVLDENKELIGKSDIFFERTLREYAPVTSVSTPQEALIISMAEKLCVDIPFMLSLLPVGMSAKEVTDTLQGEIFKDPFTNLEDVTIGWLHKDEYLTGDVREKLQIAKQALGDEPSFLLNVKALEQVQPPWLKASDISVKIGSIWIDPRFYEDFIKETFRISNYMADRIKVEYSGATNQWHVQGDIDTSNENMLTKTFGTKRINAYAILNRTLNQKDVRIFDTKLDDDGKEIKVLNPKETEIAMDRQEKLMDTFKKWIWKDPERRRYLEEKYNRTFNNIRNRVYDGSNLTFAGMSQTIHLRPHQKNAVARHLYGGNNLLAHVVGAGKTYAMIAQAMEAKRLGLATKSLFVVPNHLTEQWGADFTTLYPNAKVLVAKKKDFETKNRKQFISRIATGNYDAIIIGHSQFERIPMSNAYQQQHIEKQIGEIKNAIRMMKQEKGERYQIKQLELTGKRLEGKLEQLLTSKTKDSAVNFEQLGVDRLFVDEAHHYKNLFTYTKMRNVAGVTTQNAQKASDLLMKTDYINQCTHNKGVIFATGTPVSNSITELFTMEKYLMPQELEKRNLAFFDNWVSAFAQAQTTFELKPEGQGFQTKRRLAKFENLPELIGLFNQVADIITNDMIDLDLPKVHYHDVVSQPSEYQQDLVLYLSDRADEVRDGNVEPHIDNMLKITSDGRKLALDERLIDPLLPDNPSNKSSALVENAFRIYEETQSTQGTQLIFSDLATPKAKGKDDEEIPFSIYTDIREKLIEKGVPKEAIAFIHDAKTDNQKSALFEQVKSGKVRFLLGSTAKMGAGTNVQKHLKALHHIDVPWKPSDIEQREGRIVRQGNENSDVHIYRYITQNTFDAYSWQIIENKQKFIGQIMTSKSPARSFEDIDATALSYAEIKSLATGDPRFKEKMDLEVQVKKLKILEQDYFATKYDLEDHIAKHYPHQIQHYEKRISDIQKAMDTLKNEPPLSPDSFQITLDGNVYTDKEEAGKKIKETLSLPKDQLLSGYPLGEYRGFQLSVFYDVLNHTFKSSLKNGITLTSPLGNSATGMFTRMNNKIESLPELLSIAKEQLQSTKESLEEAKGKVDEPFQLAEELSSKENRLSSLTKELKQEEFLKKQNRQNKSPDGKKSILKGIENAKEVGKNEDMRKEVIKNHDLMK